MKLRHQNLIAALALTFSFIGCSDHKLRSGPAEAGRSSSMSVEAAANRWLGQWDGPEGNYLRLADDQGKYEIIVRNLDGARTFYGSATGDQIQFERDGLKESIRATGGAETGMKWLSNKSNCLTIRTGEGYCRD